MRRMAWRTFIVIFIGGFLGELLFMVAGLLLSNVIIRLMGIGNLTDLALLILGALVGCAIGSGVGAHLTRRRITGTGSWGLAVLGGALGVVIVMILAEPLRLNQVPWLLWGLILLLSPVLAALLGNVYNKLQS